MNNRIDLNNLQNILTKNKKNNIDLNYIIQFLIF